MGLTKLLNVTYYLKLPKYTILGLRSVHWKPVPTSNATHLHLECLAFPVLRCHLLEHEHTTQTLTVDATDVRNIDDIFPLMQQKWPSLESKTLPEGFGTQLPSVVPQVPELIADDVRAFSSAHEKFLSTAQQILKLLESIGSTSKAYNQKPKTPTSKEVLPT